MTIAIIYIGLFILTVSLYFVKKEWNLRYKKWLLFGHFVALTILLADIYSMIYFSSSLRTVWLDRIIALLFFSSGALTFVLYRKTIKPLTKIYFGLFFFYPLFAPLTFLIDRIFFALVASPLIVSLVTPTIFYTDSNYDIRGMHGLIAPNRLLLINKSIVTETEVGKSDQETIDGNYTDLKVIISNRDSTVISVDIEGKQTNLTFRK